MGVNKPLSQEDIRQYVTEDLVAKIKEEQNALEKLKFHHAVSQIDNPVSIRAKRRDVARLKTELTNRNKALKA